MIYRISGKWLIEKVFTSFRLSYDYSRRLKTSFGLE